MRPCGATGGARVCWNAKIIEIVTDAQREWLQFTNWRLVAYMALPQDLGTCRSFPEVCSVYTEFFHKAVVDYQKHFADIVKPDGDTVGAINADLHYANTSTTPDHLGRLHGGENDHA
jgi:hypothetical protein